MKTNIGVFFGGRSVEHEISIISAIQAINSFDTDKYSIIPVYVTKKGKWYSGDALLELANYKNMDSLLQRCTEVYMKPVYGDYNLYSYSSKLFSKNVIATLDIVFPAFHGTNGEDGVFQGVIETIGIPFVGCNTLSSCNGMDKIFMKMILKDCGIPVIDCLWFTDIQYKNNKESILVKIEKEISYPVIVKPANLGSSIGISKAENRDELIRGIELASQFVSRIIVERMVVKLKEINCSVLGDCDECEVSVCEEPVKTDAILSYKDKYMGGSKSSKGMQSTTRKLPAEIPASMSEEIQYWAKETFRVLSCNGVSRVDFIIDEDTNLVYVNEINTIPGSLSFYLWEASGCSFREMLNKLISLALKRHRREMLKIGSYDQNIFNMTGGMKTGKITGK